MSDILKVADELEELVRNGCEGGDTRLAPYITGADLLEWAARLRAARLSRYTPGETEEVRLLRELRRKAEAWRDACQAESGQAIAGQDVCEVLDALSELEGRDGTD